LKRIPSNFPRTGGEVEHLDAHYFTIRIKIQDDAGRYFIGYEDF
jgi:hypothetical protein